MGNKGPIEILCDEIGYGFTSNQERPEVLVAFVKVLVGHIRDMRGWQTRIAPLTKVPPSKASGDILERVEAVLCHTDLDVMTELAREAHRHPIFRDDHHSDHLSDMLGSCLSAIQFGLEQPCQSRHAAEAADHIWKIKYGVSLFDKFTNGWSKDWACAQLRDAMAQSGNTDARE